jgi:hypothetical protein
MDDMSLFCFFVHGCCPDYLFYCRYVSSDVLEKCRTIVDTLPRYKGELLLMMLQSWWQDKGKNIS